MSDRDRERFEDEYDEYVAFRDDMREADDRGYFPPTPPNSDEEIDNDDNDELLLHNRRPYTGPGLLDEEDEAAMEEDDRLAEGAAEALAQEQAEQESAIIPEARPELIFAGKKYISNKIKLYLSII